MSNRVLVCGGRNFTDAKLLNWALDTEHRSLPISVIIHGGQTGADQLGEEWAHYNGVTTEPFLASWRYGKIGGPARNTRMLVIGRPDLVIVFPGGIGTRDMLRQAREWSTSHPLRITEISAMPVSR